MANSEKLLRALLAKAYKMQETEIDSLLDESTTDADGETQITNLDKSRIAELSKPKQGQTFQDGYKKAKSEVLTQLEKDVKEKYSIESDATGIELFDFLINEKSKGGKPKELTEDDVRRHPVYQNAEKLHKQALKETNTTWETKYAERENQYKKIETFGMVSKKAQEILNSMNPVLSANPTVAANVQNAFLSNLQNFEYEIQDNGSRIIAMKDGKIVEDGHGHTLDFEKLVKDTASGYFEFKQNNGGGNAGNGNPADKNNPSNKGGNTPAYPAGINKPKNIDELSDIMNNTAIPVADRRIVMQTWEADNANKT